MCKCKVCVCESDAVYNTEHQSNLLWERASERLDNGTEQPSHNRWNDCSVCILLHAVTLQHVLWTLDRERTRQREEIGSWQIIMRQIPGSGALKPGNEWLHGIIYWHQRHRDGNPIQHDRLVPHIWYKARTASSFCFSVFPLFFSHLSFFLSQNLRLLTQLSARGQLKGIRRWCCSTLPGRMRKRRWTV